MLTLGFGFLQRFFCYQFCRRLSFMEGWGDRGGSFCCVVAKHIPEGETGRSIHRIASSQFRTKNNKNGNFLIHIHCNSCFFFLLLDFSLGEVTWKINRKVLSSAGMKGELECRRNTDRFPKHS